MDETKQFSAEKDTRSLQESEWSLQKKLIWPNLAVLVIALAAGLSLLFGPWLDIRVQVDEPLVQELLDTADFGNSEDMAKFVLKDVQAEVRITATPYVLLQAGTASDRSGLRNLVKFALHDLMNAAETICKQILPAAITLAVAESIALPEGMTYEDLDTSVFNETIELLGEQKPEEAKDSFMKAVDIFAADSLRTELDDEKRAEVEELYDEAIGLMTVDGEFSFARLPDAAQLLLNKYGDVSQLPLAQANMRASAADATAAEDGSDGSDASDGSAAATDDINSFFSFLQDPDRFVDDLDEETVAQLKLICYIAGVAMYALAAVWLILAVFAFVHIFTADKRVSLWYAKAFGLLPFLVFVALPIVMLAVLPALVSQMPSLAVAFLGTTVIAAVCYIALWLVSIFWMYPIKSRISYLNEKRKTAARAARNVY